MKVVDVLEQFPKKTALVVGDICLDRWCTYDPAHAEPSRETGIPRLAVVRTEITPGAGGTVANNLAALKTGRVSVLGAIGEDGNGLELVSLLNASAISPELLVRSPLLSTFTYTKLINAETGIEDQPRVDIINTRQLPDQVERQIMHHLQTFWRAFDVIFVSDQAETRRGGVVTPEIRSLIAELAVDDPEKIIWVDSRIRSEFFRHVILKPNLLEAETTCVSLFGQVDYVRLRTEVKARSLFVTQGAKGVLVVNDEGETLVPTRQVETPVDICGAGDSFSAGAGVALAITRSEMDAARMGNLVSSITITKKGTGTASVAEVLAAAEEMGW
jgi:rfaE bifunctional protein kinase chain/domain